jgi:hypothetical protein
VKGQGQVQGRDRDRSRDMDRDMDMDIEILKEKFLISDNGTALLSEKDTFVWLNFLQHWTRTSDV